MSPEESDISSQIIKDTTAAKIASLKEGYDLGLFTSPAQLPYYLRGNTSIEPNLPSFTQKTNSVLPTTADGVSPTGFVEDFFGKLSTWSGAIPLQSFWVIVIKFPQGLINKLSEFVYSYEELPWDGYNQNVFYNLISSLYQSNQSRDFMYGCYFARNISIPGERIDVSNTGFNQQGLLFPNVIKSRNTLQDINISFMETNDSFVDVVLRPWSILGSYMGSVARPANQTIKGTIDAIFYAKTEPGNDIVVRKIFTFNNVIPLDINTQEHTYTGDALLVRSVRFMYSSYTVGNNTLV